MKRSMIALALLALSGLTLAGTAYAPSEEELRSLWTLMEQPWIFQG
ncbi:hypothetical protein [Alcanivorax jadensis]|nr:hypothetical protein [Alcanivorax jadensis]